MQQFWIGGNSNFFKNKFTSKDPLWLEFFLAIKSYCVNTATYLPNFLCLSNLPCIFIYYVTWKTSTLFAMYMKSNNLFRNYSFQSLKNLVEKWMWTFFKHFLYDSLIHLYLILKSQIIFLKESKTSLKLQTIYANKFCGNYEWQSLIPCNSHERCPEFIVPKNPSKM